MVYSDAELLELWRGAFAAVASGQSYSINGRSLTRANSAEIRENITWLETRILDASEVDCGGTVLAVFNQPN